MTSIEIRVLGSSGMEDHHAHLLRLDPQSRSRWLAGGNDDHGIDGHCLRLIAAQAILIGGYINGVMRASLEIVPDRTARQADALFTAESTFCSPTLTQMLLVRLLDEARGYRLTEVKLHGAPEAALFESAALTNGVEIEPGAPQRLRFPPAAASMHQPPAAQLLAASYA
jgi:hypothetical protein